MIRTLVLMGNLFVMHVNCYTIKGPEGYCAEEINWVI